MTSEELDAAVADAVAQCEGDLLATVRNRSRMSCVPKSVNSDQNYGNYAKNTETRE